MSSTEYKEPYDAFLRSYFIWYSEKNSKHQTGCSPLHPPSLPNDKFKHQRERERERREGEKCCLTCKNNVGISRTFFSIQTAIKTSIPFLFLTRHVYSVTNIPCHRYCLLIEFYIHWVYKYDEVNKLWEQTFLERYYISFPFLLRNKIFLLH